MLNSLLMAKLWIEAKFNRFLRDENGEVNIVAIVILIGIAVALALVFRQEIMKLIKDLLNKITTTGMAAAETEPPTA